MRRQIRPRPPQLDPLAGQRLRGDWERQERARAMADHISWMLEDGKERFRRRTRGY